jgi:hypothetical protein
LDKVLETKILFEMSQIDKLFNSHEPLLNLCKTKKPDLIEMSAAALFLHSFYNGTENILKLVIKFYDRRLPRDTKWHMELLETAFIPNKNRKEIFRNELQKTLEEYLQFRHFVRHSYGFQLEWERMESLIANIVDIWALMKEDINLFVVSN